MSNNLEGFVKTNKKSFEVKGPSSQLWNRIEAELDKKKHLTGKRIKIYPWMSIAALLIVSVGIYFANHYQTNKKIVLADVSPHYGKKEVHFVTLIEEKRDSLELHAKENPELFQKFVGDLKKLDENYEMLKTELQISPNPEAVVSEMIKNLEIQADLLSRQLSIINQVNQYKKENII
ncbi:MAG: hypothetical protein ACQUHE_00055 [Bacteroidia bacterium]